MRLPDFIIAGAPRSGTTWLYRVLDLHPDVHMARPARPEPKFFLDDNEYARGLAAYSERWFAGVTEAVCGEKTTNYMESSVAAARMAADIPGVRLIFILREPAARACSNYAWSRMNGLEALSLAEALEAETSREAAYPPAQRYSRPHSYFSRGLYAGMLRPYFDLFPRRQLLVLKFEELVARPAALISRVHDFLGVTPQPEAAAGMGVINAADSADCPETVMASLRRRYAAPNAELEALLGPGFEAW